MPYEIEKENSNSMTIAENVSLKHFRGGGNLEGGGIP